MFCPHCGSRLEAGDKFCSACGQAADFKTDDRHTAGTENAPNNDNSQDGIADKQEYFNTRVSTLAKIRLNSAKKAQVFGIVIYIAFGVLFGLFSVFAMLIMSGRFPTEVVVGSLVCAILVTYISVWLNKARQKLITEYAVIGATTTAYLCDLFMVVNKEGTRGGAMATIPYLFLSIVVIWALYCFNAEFHAQAPRMEDSLLMRQRNSLTKVIVFWAISIVFIVIPFFLSNAAIDTKGDPEDTIAGIFSAIMLIIAGQSFFAWKAYKITKLLKTGNENGSSQALHAVSCLIIGVGVITNLSVIPTIMSIK